MPVNGSEKGDCDVLKRDIHCCEWLIVTCTSWNVTYWHSKEKKKKKTDCQPSQHTNIWIVGYLNPARRILWDGECDDNAHFVCFRMWRWHWMFLLVPSVEWRRWVEPQAEEKTRMAWKSLARCVCVCMLLFIYLKENQFEFKTIGVRESEASENFGWLSLFHTQ